jgi:predicted RNase H-like nuclease (RuvC/YqgF family)
LDLFDGAFQQYIHRGDKNKILVDANGLAILKRMKELEDNGRTVEEALNIVKQELHGQREPQADSGLDLNDKLVETLEKQIAFLEEQLRARDREIERLHSIIENYLPQLPPAKPQKENVGWLRRLFTRIW